MISVPPPTRGWPRQSPTLASRGQGSPAHAGMALTLAARFATVTGFPRPRGDGPGTSKIATIDPAVPPPTRGWPTTIQIVEQQIAGSPAHAGMAPDRASPPSARWWFPRPRGDGPNPKATMRLVDEVPPPTRGWPQVVSADIICFHGSPAHAGMALSTGFQALGESGFPRPRGDGPAIPSVSCKPAMVPPPTRGWPQLKARIDGGAVGSPAHAGMAPERRSPGRKRVGFPRPRGDGPFGSWWYPGRTTVPPPTRGWPRPSDRHGAFAVGSPAHAGMALTLSSAFPARSRFPRPRGDGPPACRGPGDAAEVPPPTRGWPHQRDGAAKFAAGSPAHAGMAA